MDHSKLDDGDVSARITDLVGDMMEDYNPVLGLGSMSCNVYDSAWVACVSKRVGSSTQWLFPSTFYYVLDAQSPSGRFPAHPGDEESAFMFNDDVLATLAALFMLKRFEANRYQLWNHSRHLALQVSQAVDWLTTSLKVLQLDQSVGVGFEILVPALLELLERDGIMFNFPAKATLYAMRAEKFNKISPKSLYERAPSALLHSLEAFYGSEDFEFDLVEHHKVQGSMMGSPSATAAYLMRRSEWDDEAEGYLRLVASKGGHESRGGVPSAYPSTNFEILWVLSTLLHAGTPSYVLGEGRIESILSVIDSSLVTGHGLVGFAAGIQPDVDDSAKASIVRCLLGQPGLAVQIQATFGKGACFATYVGERNESFSANCNALLALLLDDPSKSSASILNLAKYLCDAWSQSSETPKDKWNTSPLYTSMLFAQALILLLQVWQDGYLPHLQDFFLRESVVLSAFQCLLRVLKGQQLDGGWDHSSEVTAYSILALAELSRLPMVTCCRQEIETAIARGRRFIRCPSTSQPKAEYLWIEKVAYGSPYLRRAYILAAMSIASPREQLGASVEGLCEIPYSKMPKFIELSQRLPMFKDSPKWLITASWVESRLYLPRLRSVQSSIFRREGMLKDKYFEWIPFTWTTVNNINGSNLSLSFLREMMTLSLLNYQVDEFMEVVVGGQFGHQLDQIHTLVDNLFDKSLQVYEDCERTPTRTTDGKIIKNVVLAGQENLAMSDSNTVLTHSEHDMSKIITSLQDYIDWVTNRDVVEGATQDEKLRLRTQLRRFLHAHIVQAEDNQEFVLMRSDGATNKDSECLIFRSARQRYREWVRTTSAQHTSCPFSFEFAVCITSSRSASNRSGIGLLSSVEQRYFSSDICDHLATMCRMYNDRGSLKRDRHEWNVNSVNFPDFHMDLNSGRRSGHSEEELVQRLSCLGQYERRCLSLALEELQKVANKEVMRLVRVFIDITDLFGQIYIIEDIGSRRS